MLRSPIIRRSPLVVFTMLFISGLLSILLLPQLGALAAPDPVTAAWQQARAAGAYHFHTTATHTTISTATVTNVGRPSTQRSFVLEGQTTLADQRLQLRIWEPSRGQNPEQALEVYAEQGQIRARNGDGPWETLEDYPDLFAPGGDVLAYLAAVREPVEVGRERRAGYTVTRYAFTLDGPRFAAYLQDRYEQKLTQQGKLPPGVTLATATAYEDMTGQGELWVDERGLPLRQILTITLPGRDGARIVGQINTDFAGYSPGVTPAFLPAAPQLHQAFTDWLLPLLLVGGVAALLIGYRRRSWLRGLLAVGLCVVMVVGPFQTQLQVAEYSTAQAAEAEEYTEQQDQQVLAEQFRAAVHHHDFDPHRDPLAVVRGTATAAGAVSSDSERQQTQEQLPVFICYEMTFDRLTGNLPAGQYWLHVDGFQHWYDSASSGVSSVTLSATTTYPVCVEDGASTDVQVRVRQAADSTTTLYDAVEYATGFITIDNTTAAATQNNDTVSGTLTFSKLADDTEALNPLTAHYTIAQKQLEELNDLVVDDATDSDLDGLTDWQESQIGTDPRDKVMLFGNEDTVIGTLEGFDSDGDGLSDLQEIQGFSYADKRWYTDPLALDSNGDGRDDSAEWGFDADGNLLAIPLDTDANGTPDLFDMDDDGDGVPDTLDTSVLGAPGLNQPFTEDRPFRLALQNLEANKPTYIDLQFRPTDPEHLQFALSVLDWPEDRQGQVQDHDNKTYQHVNGDGAGPNDYQGDMKLVPLLQVDIRSTPSFLPLLDTPAYTITLDPLTLTAAVTRAPITVNLVETPSGVKVTLAGSGVVETDQLQIVEGRCNQLTGAATLYDNLLVQGQTTTIITNSSTATISSTIDSVSDLRTMVQSGRSLIVLRDGAPYACGGLSDLVFEQVDHQTKLVDLSLLRSYGISVHDLADPNDANATPHKQLLIPVVSVADQETGAPVAFASKLFLQRPTATAAAPEIETRFIWGVQMLQDFCTDYEHNHCSAAGETNVIQLLHSYPDAWHLTGVDVREEQGSDVAIIYEDPAQKADGLNEHNGLLYLADYLSSNLDLPALTVDSLPDRFDYTLNSTATTTETVGLSDLSDLNIMRVETFTRYNHRDAMLADIVNHQTSDVLTRAGQPNATGSSIAPLDQHIPLLLFLRSERYHTVPALTTLNGDGVTLDGASLTIDFADTFDTEVEGKAVNWAPYAYDESAGAWDSYSAEQYYEAMELLYPAESFNGGPNPVTDPEEQELRQFAAQLYFLSLYSGEQALQLPEFAVPPIVSPDTIDSAWLQSRLGYVEDQNNILRAWADDFAEIYAAMSEIKRSDAVQKSVSGIMKPPKGLKQVPGATRVTATLVVLTTLYALAIFLTPQGRDAVLGTEEGRIATAVIVGSMIAYVGVYKPLQVSMFLEGLESMHKNVKAKATRNLRIATAIFTTIAIGMQVGFFIHFFTAGNLTTIQKKAVGANFAGSVVLIVALAIISVIPPWGPVIAGVFGLIDFFVSLFAPRFSLARFVFGYDYEFIVGPPQVELALSTQLVNIPRGYTVGNQMQVSSPVSVTIQSNEPESWQARAWAWKYWDKDNAKGTSVTYEFDEGPTIPSLRPMDGEWQNERWLGSFGTSGTKGNLYSYNTVYNIEITVPLDEAGLNQQPAIHLNSTMRLPTVECWTVLFTPWCNRTNHYIDEQTFIGDSPSLLRDIFPATLDEFRELASTADGGWRLAWDERFPVLHDADGDGLISTAHNGNDPNDTDWDSDNDGLSDRTELELREGGSQFSSIAADTDGDGLADLEEFRNGTDPAKRDTDGDGLEDDEEINGWLMTVRSSASSSPTALQFALDAGSDTQTPTFPDRSPSGNDATCEDGRCPTVVYDTTFGDVLQFDGTDDLLTLPSTQAAAIGDQITLAAWVRPTATDGIRNIIAKGYTLDPNGEVQLRIENGHYQVGSWYGFGVGGHTSAAMEPGDLHSWVHLVGTYDGTSWRLYRNGVQIAATAAPNTLRPVPAAPWGIGARSIGSERAFAGDMAQARIYNRALTVDEIQNLYTPGVPMSDVTLSVWVTSDPLDPDADLDGVNDQAEKQLAARGYNPSVFNEAPLALYLYADDADGIVMPGQIVNYTTTVLNNLPGQTYDRLTLQTDLPAEFVGEVHTNQLDNELLNNTDITSATTTFQVAEDVLNSTTSLVSTLRGQLPSTGHPDALTWQTNLNTFSPGSTPDTVSSAPSSNENGTDYVIATQVDGGTNGVDDVRVYDHLGNSLPGLRNENGASYPQTNAYHQGSGPPQVVCNRNGDCMTVWDREDRCHTLTVDSIATNFRVVHSWPEPSLYGMSTANEYSGETNGADLLLFARQMGAPFPPPLNGKNPFNLNERNEATGGYQKLWHLGNVPNSSIGDAPPPAEASYLRHANSELYTPDVRHEVPIGRQVNFCDQLALELYEWDTEVNSGNYHTILWENVAAAAAGGQPILTAHPNGSITPGNTWIVSWDNDQFTLRGEQHLNIDPGYSGQHNTGGALYVELKGRITPQQTAQVAGAVFDGDTIGSGASVDHRFELMPAGAGAIDAAPVVVSNGDEFLVVWRRKRSEIISVLDMGFFGTITTLKEFDSVYFQRFTAGGTALGVPTSVQEYFTQRQVVGLFSGFLDLIGGDELDLVNDPQVVWAGDRYLVAWKRVSTGQIELREVATDGVPLGNVITVGPGNQPQLAYDPDKGQALLTILNDTNIMAYQIPIPNDTNQRVLVNAASATGIENATGSHAVAYEPFQQQFVLTWRDTRGAVQTRSLDATYLSQGPIVQTFASARDDLALSCPAPEAVSIADWTFEEAAGSTSFADRSPTDQALTCSGDTCPAAGALARSRSATNGDSDRALFFDGANDALTTSSTILSDRSFTISAWTRRASANTEDTLVSQGNDLHFGFMADNRLECKVGIMSATSQPQSDTDAWQHWACVYNGATLGIYRNGEAITTRFVLPFTVPGGTFRLGRNHDGSAAFHGFLDDVQLHQVALSPQTLQEQYNERNRRYCLAATPATTGDTLDLNQLTLTDTFVPGGLIEQTASLPFIIDAEQPTVAISLTNEYLQPKGELIVGGSASDNTNLEQVEVQFLGQEWQPATGTAAWSTPLPLTGLAEGAYTISARAHDVVGNTSVNTTNTFYIDNTPPIVTVALTELVEGSGIINVRPTQVAGVWQLALSGTATDPALVDGSPGSRVAQVEVLLEGSTGNGWQAASLNDDGTWSLDYIFTGISAEGQQNDPSGIYILQVRTTDAVGNTSEAWTAGDASIAAETDGPQPQLVIDLQAPTVELDPDIGLTLTDTRTFAEILTSTTTLTGTVAELESFDSGVDRVEVAFVPAAEVINTAEGDEASMSAPTVPDGTQWYPTTLDTSTPTIWSLTLPAGLEGLYQVHVRATDQRGNQHEQPSWRGEIDTSPPRLTLDVTYSGSNATLQAEYTCTATDWNLDEASMQCPLPPAAATSCAVHERTFHESDWWDELVRVPAQLVGVTASCQQPVTSSSEAELHAQVCDTAGLCTQVAGNITAAATDDPNTTGELDVTLLTPAAGTIGQTDPLTVVPAAQAPADSGITSLALLIDGTPTFTETVVGTGTTSLTSTITWQPPLGTSTLAAQAVSDSGSVVTSTPVTIIVDPTPLLITHHIPSAEDSLGETVERLLSATDPTTPTVEPELFQVVTSTHVSNLMAVIITGTVQSDLGALVDIQVGDTQPRPVAVTDDTWEALWPLPTEAQARDGIIYPIVVNARDSAQRTGIGMSHLLVDTEPPTEVPLTLRAQHASGAHLGIVVGQQLGVQATRLELSWEASTDGSGIAGYAAGWSTEPDPDITTLTAVGPDGPFVVARDLPAATTEERWYAHLVSWDNYGNQQLQIVGPISRTPQGGDELQVIYVDADATAGANDGSSWADAYRTLQDALADPRTSSSVEIWVAAGTYYPTEGNDRFTSFQLLDGVAIYGGFAGDETSHDDRDWEANVTVLSGDIGTPGTIADNSYNVVTSDSRSASALLDGFTITGGNATLAGDGRRNGGGGIDTVNSSAVFQNLIVMGNQGGFGGGIRVRPSDRSSFTNIVVTNNTAVVDNNPLEILPGQGGGIYVFGGDAGETGTPTFRNVQVAGNTALRGGGLYNVNANGIYINIAMSGNQADVLGGGVFVDNGRTDFTNVPSFTNVTIAGNQATDAGGGVYNLKSIPSFQNSIIWGNASNHPNQVFNDGGSPPSYSSSLVQGLANASDPLFVAPTAASTAPTSTGDYRLQAGSPAIDAGSSSFIGASTDLAGNPRTVGPIDLGPYEWQASAVDSGTSSVAPSNWITDTQRATPSELSFALAAEQAATFIWTVPDETGVQGYRIERDNGAGWTVLSGFLAAEGNRTYTWTDPQPIAPAPYRLVVVHSDGREAAYLLDAAGATTIRHYLPLIAR